MSIVGSVKKIGFRTAYDYLDKDPDANIPKLMDWVDRFAGDGPNSFPAQRAAFRKAIEGPDNNWHRLIRSMWTDVDDEVRKTKPLLVIDFQNDGEYVGGCIAGGRRYLHINANGDVDPCVFIHSTDLQSPESAEHLCAKCDAYAENWKPTADRLWACSHDCAACGKSE